jgi:hypothetical protein
MTLHDIPIDDSHVARLDTTRNAVFRLEVSQILTVRRANRKSIRLQMLNPLAAAAARGALVHIDGRPLLLLPNQRRHRSD